MREALGKGNQLYKAGFQRVALLALAGSVAANAPRLFDASAFDLSDALGGGVPMADPSALAWITVAQLVALFFQLAVVARLHAAARHREMATGAALAAAARRFPAMLVVLVAVLVLIAGGVAFAALIASGLAVGLLPQLPLPAEVEPQLLLLVVTMLGTLVFALPLATVIVYWYFAFFLVVTEARSGLSALRRSFQLVRGRLWRMKFALTVVYFVFFAALLLAEALAAGAAALLRVAHLPGDLAAFVVVALGGAVAGPWPMAASLALLHDLARRGESSATTKRHAIP